MTKIILPLIALTMMAGAASAHGRQAPVANVQAQVGNHGQVAKVGVTVGGTSGHNPSSLVNLNANVGDSGRSNGNLLNVQTTVGGSQGRSSQGSLVNVNANLLGNGRSNSGLASINVGLLSGGVGGHGDSNEGW